MTIQQLSFIDDLGNINVSWKHYHVQEMKHKNHVSDLVRSFESGHPKVIKSYMTIQETENVIDVSVWYLEGE